MEFEDQRRGCWWRRRNESIAHDVANGIGAPQTRSRLGREIRLHHGDWKTNIGLKRLKVLKLVVAYAKRRKRKKEVSGLGEEGCVREEEEEGRVML